MEKIKEKRPKLTKEQRARRREFTSQFYRKNKLMFMLAIIGYIGMVADNLLCAELLARVTNAATGRSWELLISAFKLLAVSITVGLVQNFLRRFAINRFVERAMRQYKEYAFSLVMKKNIGSFLREDSGTYISALTNDAAQIDENYLRNILAVFFYILMFFAAIPMLFWYSWKVTLVALVLSSLPMIASMLLGGKMVTAEKKVSDKNAGFVGLVKDLLSGFTVVKSFRSEKEVAEKFDENSGELEHEKRRRKYTEWLVNIVCGQLGGIVQVGSFVVGAALAIAGEMEVGAIVGIIQLLNYVIMPINNVPQSLAKIRASGALIDKLADACAENEARGGTKKLENIGEGIRFEHVDFGYTPDEPVLKDLCAEFKTGKSYAIVGASGSGKSTLLNLMLGYRDDYSGEIHIDGAELRDVDMGSLYDMISTIQQNVFIFNSTIEENITMFKDFPPEVVASAARRAELDKLIEEKGHGYACGENGSGLSGGERQRISIARSLVRGAPVLLMDEATAALDAKTAHAVEDSILSIDGLTRIIVTHRLEKPLLERYDEIVVMSGGRVVEQGSFEELMANSGHFAALYSVAQG